MYENLEEDFIMKSEKERAEWFMGEGLLKRSRNCSCCSTAMTLSNAKRYTDGVAWRCEQKGCIKIWTRCDIRKNSFLEGFSISLKTVFKILIKYVARIPNCSILQLLGVSRSTLQKLLDKIIGFMETSNNSAPMMGGPGTIVQVDETMLNYRCKSHRGRSPSNRTDAICIVEVRSAICRVLAEVIHDKSASTLLPIIIRRVLSGSTIHTDEHASYRRLSGIGFSHYTVCHKYNFVNPQNGTHTQHVESFNNALKVEVKKKKGIIQ
jgi:transposase-like protein